MKSNLSIIKKEAEIFGFLFLRYGATILICPLLNILDSGANISFDVLGIIYYQGYLSNGGKNTEHSYVLHF